MIWLIRIKLSMHCTFICSVTFMEVCLHRTMQHNKTQYVINTHAYGILNKDVIMHETMTCYITETQTKMFHTKLI